MYIQVKLTLKTKKEISRISRQDQITHKKTGWYQTSQEHTQQDNCGKKHFQENSNASQGFYIKQNDPSSIKANKKVIFKCARTQETVYPWTLLEESTAGWASCKQEIGSNLGKRMGGEHLLYVFKELQRRQRQGHG